MSFAAIALRCGRAFSFVRLNGTIDMGVIRRSAFAICFFTFGLQFGAAFANGGLVVTPEDLISIVDIESVAVSPDGAYVAYQLRRADPLENTYDIRWYAKNIERNKNSHDLGDAGDLKLLTSSAGIVNGHFEATSPAKWSPDSKWVAYLKDINGAVQIWMSRRDGHRQVKLTKLPSNVRDFEWAPDGDKIILRAENRTRSEIAAARNIEARRGFHFDDRFWPSSGPDPIFPRETALETWVLTVGNRNIRKATKEEADLHLATINPRSDLMAKGARIVAYSPNKQQIAIAQVSDESEKGPYSPLSLQLISGDKTNTCRPAICHGHIAAIWWTPDGNEIVFYKTDGINLQDDSYFAWNPQTGAVRLIFSDQDTLLRGCDLGHAELFCIRETPNSPPALVAVDLKTSAVRVIDDPNGRFLSVDFGRFERIEWKNPDGFEYYPEYAYGYIIYPPDFDESKQYPLIVAQYRARGFQRGAFPGDEYPIYPLAAAGFIVFVFDRPLPWKALGRFADMAERQRLFFGNNQSDRRFVLATLERGLDEVIKLGNVDTNMIGISGLSDGANSSFYALQYSDRFAAASVSSGTWEPFSFYLSNQTTRKKLKSWGLGDPRDEAEQVWKGIAPSWNAERISAPILINASDQEFLLATPVIAALQELNKPVDAYVYPNEHHLKWQPAHRFAIYRRNIQWFRFWLQGVEEANPVDPQQYKRWREMRNDR